MIKQEKIAKKVKNLLAIAKDDHASDAEIQNAMNHAHRLMGEYHLTEDDLSHEPQDDYANVDNANFTRQKSYIGRKAYLWESTLAHFVCDFVGIPFYITNQPEIARKNGIVLLDEKGKPRQGKAYVFYGIAEDAIIAADLYDELRLLISTMAVARWASVYKGEGAVYSQGFVAGLNSQLEESRFIGLNTTKDSPTTLILIHRRDDLIEYKKKKANNYLNKELGIKLVSGQGKPGASGSHAAYSEGQADGSKTSISAARSKKLC